jgi:acyl-CoA synthetase (AMP-forming)/AMP-acid ligase II
MHLAVGDLIVRNAFDRPDDVALIDGAQVFAWRDLKDRSCRLANGLHRLGIAPTDRIATVIRNGVAAVEALFGLSLGGHVWVPINYGLGAREIEVLLDDSRPDAIILDAEFIPQIKPLLRDRKLTVIVRDAVLHSGWLDYDIVLAASSSDTPTAPSPADVRTIRYTSGTTAAPKGCVGTHRQILASIDNFFHDVPVPDGPFLQLLPLFSGAGIWMAIAAAYRGLPNVLMPSFDSGKALHLIDAHKVAHACGVPTMLRRLCDDYEVGTYDVSSLKLFGYTGSAMPESVIRRALNVLPCDFYQGFGGGELGGLVSFLLPDVHRAVAAGTQPARRLSSAGRIATYAEVVIRDIQSGEVVARNDIGEITVRSPSNFSGYHNRPDETANTLRGPWVYTGDVGYIDDDGFLFVVDRVKDMVLSGGMNISSAEVEAVLVEHPAVQAAAVIGVPDEEWGERVTGVVTTRPGAQVTEADLIKFSRERLAGYKAPKSIKFIDQLPLNSIGKVLKRELRNHFAPPQAETQARVTPLRSTAMKWTPNTSTGPRGYLVENEKLSTLDITMPIDGVAKITLNRSL